MLCLRQKSRQTKQLMHTKLTQMADILSGTLGGQQVVAKVCAGDQVMGDYAL